jgi:hypothetical protein
MVVDVNTSRTGAATWNGTGMTSVGLVPGAATAQQVQIFRLVNPAVGTFDLVLSHNGGASESFGGTAICFTGVDQGTPDDAAVTNSGGTITSIAVTVSSATDDLVLDCVGVNGNPTITATAGQTERANQSVNGGGGTMEGMSTKPGTTSVQMEWSFASSTRVGQVGININAAAGGGGRTTKNTRAFPLGMDLGMNWQVL